MIAVQRFDKPGEPFRNLSESGNRRILCGNGSGTRGMPLDSRLLQRSDARSRSCYATATNSSPNGRSASAASRPSFSTHEVRSPRRHPLHRPDGRNALAAGIEQQEAQKIPSATHSGAADGKIRTKSGESFYSISISTASVATVWPSATKNLLHRTRIIGRDGVLHLHGFEHENLVVRLDRIPHFHFEFDPRAPAAEPSRCCP